MGILVCWARTFLDRRTKELTPWHAAVLVVRIAATMIVLQILEALVWACFYRWECFPAWDTSFYFSAASYSIVLTRMFSYRGFGDH
jgi:voltage-gated potassium channel